MQKADCTRPRLKAGDGERLHELPDQNVIQVVRNAPQEEKHGDQNERNKLTVGKEVVSGTLRAAARRVH